MQNNNLHTMDMTSPDQVNIASGSHDVKDYLDKNNIRKSNGIDLNRKANNYSHSRQQNTLY